jgi:hypothetical protein
MSSTSPFRMGEPGSGTVEEREEGSQTRAPPMSKESADKGMSQQEENIYLQQQGETDTTKKQHPDQNPPRRQDNVRTATSRSM